MKGRETSKAPLLLSVCRAAGPPTSRHPPPFQHNCAEGAREELRPLVLGCSHFLREG